jgi:hypothetical protein
VIAVEEEEETSPAGYSLLSGVFWRSGGDKGP